MPKRIRILACTFALGVGMLLLGATAAQAAPGGGGGGTPSPSRRGWPAIRRRDRWPVRRW